MTTRLEYAMRRTAAVLFLILCVTWITPPLDSAGADGGGYGGGGRSTAGATTGSATERSTDMSVPSLGEAQSEVEAGRAEQPWKEVAPGIVEIQWFHPQTGELLFAVGYNARSGEVVGVYEAR